ncbi:MAG: sugar phosphate isomerase/epimerase [Planctomycetales bacterium]|nr:sugar phosphate isomerase/epimerase [Planctomycetales bacterium]
MTSCRQVTRREMLALASALPLGAWIAGRGVAAEPAAALGLGFSLYGMRSLPLADALTVCAEIGYDCVELPVMKDWPADSAGFDKPQRETLKRQLTDRGLRLSALMENLPIFGDEDAHRQNLQRLRLAGDVAHALWNSPGPPIVETILGGKPAQWPEVKGQMARRLEDWSKVAEAAGIVVAIKAHVGGAMHLPGHPAELVKQLNSKWIRAAYDFSHFRLRDVELPASIATLAPLSVFVHVKDAAGDASKVRFLLPGEGDIDYVALIRGLVQSGYRGDVVVEVSGQIHGKAGYDPKQAARASYRPLALAMKTAGVSRH